MTIEFDDREFIVPPISEICVNCINLIDSGIGRKCRAFPNGIPLIIWNGENDHTSRVEGDNGILFEEFKV